MLKSKLIFFTLPLLLLLSSSSENSVAESKQKNSDPPTGTFQKMIAENGSVTMDLDLNRLNGITQFWKDPPHCILPQLPIPFFLFWFSTISCAAPSRDQWHSSLKPGPTPVPTASRCARSHLSNSSLSKNFRPTRPSTCCARRQDRIHVF